MFSLIDRDMIDMGDVPLKEHIESRLAALEKATALAASQMDRRLEGMNEFREQLKEQASGLFPRAEQQIYMDHINKEISSLKADVQILRESRAELSGKASQSSANIALAMSLIGLIIGVAALLIQFVKAKP